MRKATAWIGAGLAAMLLASAGVAQAAAAPAGAAPMVPASNAPANFSGIWNKAGSSSLRYMPNPPYTPASQKIYENERPQDDPGAKCTYSSMPRIMISPYPLEIVQWPDHILVVSEFNGVIRRIWLDRQQHTDDLFPTYQGDSYGVWEGDTLVVHTKGFNGKNFLDPGGDLMSPEMSVVERWRRVVEDGKQKIRIEFTFTDPKHYTKPWGTTLAYEHTPQFKLMESVCADNNRNNPDQPGPMNFTSTNEASPNVDRAPAGGAPAR